MLVILLAALIWMGQWPQRAMRMVDVFQCYAGPANHRRIQTLRLKLHLFASEQTDQTVRSQCQAVDTRLAESLEGDDPMLRQILGDSVEQVEAILHRAHRGDPWRLNEEAPTAKPPST
jgi:hypothetical protein